jgi:hypothetical protein
MTDDMGYNLKLPTFGEMTFPQWQEWRVHYNALLLKRGRRIEKLEAALREIGQTVTIVDENWSPSYHAPRFTQKQAEGLSEALSARIKIARKALEGKDD